MEPYLLRQELEATGLTLRQFTDDELMDLPFCEEDMLLLTECGLPAQSAPGPLTFAQGVEPASGPILQRLSDAVEQFKEVKMAKMIWVFAHDKHGNVIWIHTMSGHQVTMKDDVANTNRYVNESLGQFMQSLLAYRKFMLRHADAGAVDAHAIRAAAGPEAVAALRAALEEIDAQSFSDEDNFWKYVLEA